MKVLHVEGGRNLYGGAQQIAYLLPGLAARGLSNALACPHGGDLIKAAAPYAEVFPLRLGGDLDFGIIARLRRLIRSWRPDLVHLHSRIGADSMGGIACRLERVPVVHSRRVDNPESRLMVALKYRLFDRVIAISQGIGRVLLAEGLPPEKLRVVRSAVDCAPFERPCDRARVCDALGVPRDAVLVGVVAQLIPRKGHRFLIQALPPLVSEHPELRVLFFGKGHGEADLRRRIRAAGLQGPVRLAGFRADLPEILPCLSLVVHPATMEGLGVSLLQAACAGIPIVASNAGGIPEAVHDGIGGLLVPPGDVEALCAAVGRLLRDPELAAHMGRAGRDRMRSEYSIDTMVEGNLAVYRDLLVRDE